MGQQESKGTLSPIHLGRIALVVPTLCALQEQYPDIIGDVRGEGLMIGVEIVTDSSSKMQAPVVSPGCSRPCQ